MQHKEMTEKKRIVGKLGILLILTALLMAIFILFGLNEKNIGFYLPRRLLKMGTVIVISYCIGYSSLAFQTITNNHILTPSVMGLDSLYLFIQTIVVFFFGSKQLQMMTGLPNFFLSAGLMLLASFVLFRVLFRGEGRNVYYLVLCGMIIGNLFSGMATFMQVLLDPNEFTILQGKMFASLNNINEELFYICLITAIIILMLSIRDLSKLNVLALGTDHAINLGIDYQKTVRKIFMTIAILVSVSTVLVGPITFLGILVVSLARRMLNTYKHSYLSIGSTLIGCVFLTFGLLTVERIFYFQTTISVIINFIGGSYFIYLMLKESKV